MIIFMLTDAISIDDNKEKTVSSNRSLNSSWWRNNYSSVTIDRPCYYQRQRNDLHHPETVLPAISDLWVSELRCAPLYEWPRYRNAIICLADREIALLLASLSLHFASCIIPTASTIVPISSSFRGRTHFRRPSTPRYRAPDRTDTLASLRCKWTQSVNTGWARTTRPLFSAVRHRR